MSLLETRLGANATGLPGPTHLPPLSAALSRRAALFGAVTAAGVSAVPATGGVASSSADAALIAQADVLIALRAREIAGWDALVDADADGGPAHRGASALSADVLGAGEDLAEMRSTSPNGLAAKARAMLALVGQGTGELPYACEEHHRLVGSILRDAVRLGTGALS